METTRVKPVQKKSEPASVAQSSKPAWVAAPVIQTLPLYAGPPTIRLSDGTAGSMQTNVPAVVSQTVNAPGSGEPLPPPVQGALESGLGADMSTVRVHTGEQASAAAHTLGARAFTHGSNIFLGAGEHPSNLGLMAHEATHVIQQGGRPAVQMSSPTAPPDTLEQEARQASSAVQRGEQTTVTGRTASPRVQREEKEEGFFSGLARKAKDALLGKAAEYARRIPGYDLLTVILGKDPIADKPVERNATNLIRGLLGLIPGGSAMFDNLQQSGALQKAFDWFNQEITKLNLTWEAIKGLFRQFWDSLSASDIVHPSGVLDRIGQIFGPPLKRLINFAISAGKKILELIFEGVLSLAGSLGKQIIGIIRKAGDVFSLIVNDPIGFLKNLIQAVRGGFQKFSTNIVTHLKNALFQWLFGALQGAGLTLPEKFDLRGIISIVLQVLGLTYERLRAKLVQLIGEPAVTFIEKAFEFLKIIVTQGIAAAWQKILEFATGLIDTVIEGIRNWVAKSIVGAAITKLITMFNPVGAIIQGIITIYNTVQFFIERAKQIAALAEAVFDSIANIATGNLGAAIDYVEKTMARTLPVIIGFLARLIGLGGISGEIKKIIQKIQAVVDNAINKVVNFIMDKAKALVAKVAGKDEKPDQRTLQQKEGDLDAAIKEVQQLINHPGIPTKIVVKALPKIQSKYRLESLKLIDDGSGKYHVMGSINPTRGTSQQRLLTDEETAGLEEVAKKFAMQIKQKELVADFNKDPVGVVSRLSSGEIVEKVGRPTVERYARQKGYTIWYNVTLELYDEKGARLGGQQAELDGLLISGGGVMEILSAKLDYDTIRKEGKSKVGPSIMLYYQRNLRTITPQKARAFGAMDYGAVRGIRVAIGHGGPKTIELSDFQDRYSLSPTWSVVGLTPVPDAGPIEPGRLTIGLLKGLTKQELLQITADTIKQYL